MTDGAASTRRATVIGLLAIVFWSAMVGLIRAVSEGFGPTLGIALIYTLAAAVLWMIRRPHALRSFPMRYLLIGGGLFVLYEVAVGLSIGLALTAEQAIEVSVVNYLWPTLTVLLAVVVDRHRRPGLLLLPGVALATLGIAWVIGGEAGLDAARIAHNVASHPAPYVLALVGAAAWACYSVLSPALSGGRDGIALFFVGTAAALWIVHLLADAPALRPDTGSVIALGAAALVIGAGYACWNVGILQGRVHVLASASYATPVLSSAVAALLLEATLSLQFWQGVVLVAVGSVLSWRATRIGRAQEESRG